MDLLNRMLANPNRYLHLIPKVALQTITPLFAKTSFRLEGQMDINPRSRWYDSTFIERFGGFQLPGEPRREIVNLDAWDSVRRDMLVLLLRDIVERQVPGDIAELGVYKGHTAKLIHRYLPDRMLHLYDTFEGFDPEDVAHESEVSNRRPPRRLFSDTSVKAVLRYVNPRNGSVHIHKGIFPASVPESEHDIRYCFVHIDADLCAPIMAGLQHFYPRVEQGGYIVIHDFNAWPGARRAVTDFFKDRPEIPIPMPDKSGSALIQKI